MKIQVGTPHVFHVWSTKEIHFKLHFWCPIRILFSSFKIYRIIIWSFLTKKKVKLCVGFQQVNYKVQQLRKPLLWFFGPENFEILFRNISGRQKCREYFSVIMNFNPEDGGNTASRKLVSYHQNTWRNNSENHDF